MINPPEGGASWSQEAEGFSASKFEIKPGNVFNGEISGFFVQSENHKLNAAITYVGGEEALDLYFNSTIPGRSESEMKQKAEALKRTLDNPEVQKRILELDAKKRELEEQISKITIEYHKLFQ